MKIYSAILYLSSGSTYDGSCTSSSCMETFCTDNKEKLYEIILPIITKNYNDYKNHTVYSSIDTILSINGYSKEYDFCDIDAPTELVNELNEMYEEFNALISEMKNEYLTKELEKTKQLQLERKRKQDILERMEYERLTKKFKGI